MDWSRNHGLALRVAALVLAVGLLPLGIGVWLVRAEATARAGDALDARLLNQARALASSLENYFERASAIVLLLAREPSFRDYDESGGGASRSAVERALSQLGTLFPDTTRRARFIDRSGREIARVAGGAAASAGELSPDAVEEAFFAPTFELPAGQVYQARPYRSPDTQEWVISNSTLVPGLEAIVHFEVTMEGFRRTAAELSPNAADGWQLLIVDRISGDSLVDSAVETSRGPDLRIGEPGQFRWVGTSTLSPVVLTQDSRRYAIVPIRRAPGNANAWSVAASAPLHAAGGPTHWFLAGFLLFSGVLFAAAVFGKRWFVIAESVEASRRAHRELEELDELRRNWIQAVSHDLRTPLTSVVGTALVLESHGETIPADEQRRLVASLARAARKLQRLVGNLLDLDRMAKDCSRARREPTNVAALTRDTIAELDGSERVRVSADDVVAGIDAAQVNCIIENLVLNALRYSPSTSPVDVTVRCDGPTMDVWVEDRGPGVPDALKGAIFEPFNRGNQDDHNPGTGLGLTVASRFAEFHDGRAWVEDRPDGGARFRVRLAIGETDSGNGRAEASERAALREPVAR